MWIIFNIKDIVKNNRDGNPLNIIDLNEEDLENITLEDNRIFKLQGNLVNLLSENKNKPEEPMIDDIVEEVEEEIIAEEVPEEANFEETIKNLEQIDVLKVAHHASNSSTSNSFLEKVKPKIAIISSGSGNKGSKWPNEKCLKRLLKFIQKENIYITERDGTIWLISDGAQNIINKMNNINLDGAKSKIEPNLLTIEYLESISLSMLSFLIYK